MEKVTEQDYADLERLGAKLHIATPTAKWSFKVESQIDGEIIHEHIERAHSWVRNAYNVLVCNVCGINASGSTVGAGLLSLRNTAGTDKGRASTPLSMFPGLAEAPGTTYQNCGFISGAGLSDKGIVVGTSSTAFSFDDYKMGALVANGTGVNQMAYSASPATIKNWDTTNKIYSVTYSRLMNNNSAADIVVTEVGLIGVYTIGGNSDDGTLTLVTRDVLEAPITVPPVSQLTVTYTISIQYPA